MYRTCLFCHGDLGANEVIEAFPVGRRLAFDAAKGRLWVVCRRCERWNLTPMEERWEAIEACERAFRDTTLRVSTDNIGLARVREGLELVRIGAPQRPEMAAWRYGDQFGRRRRRYLLLSAGGAAAAGLFVFAGPGAALVGAGSAWPIFNGLNAVHSLWRQRVVINTRLADGGQLKVKHEEAINAQLRSDATAGWALRLELKPKANFWKSKSRVEEVRLVGDDALRLAAQVLPRVNRGGAGRGTVQDSVALLEEARHPQVLLRHVAREAMRTSKAGIFDQRPAGAIGGLPAPQRLALEMAVNEDVERRALEGELRLLEAAWHDAEEVAKIADDMFVPQEINAQLDRMRRGE